MNPPVKNRLRVAFSYRRCMIEADDDDELQRGQDDQQDRVVAFPRSKRD